MDLCAALKHFTSEIEVGKNSKYRQLSDSKLPLAHLCVLMKYIF